MKWDIFFVFISAVFFQVAYARSGGYIEAIESCNEYVDTLIKSILTDRGDILDPYNMNDSIISFQKKVVFVDFKGEAKLSEGYISGVSSLRRISPCSLSFENGRYKLSANLQTGAMFFNFTGSVKVMNMGPVIFVRGNSSSADISLAFSLNATTGKEALLEELKMQDIKDMNVWIDGLRLLSWMSDPLRNSAAIFFKHSVKKLIEVEIGSLANDRILGNPFSVEEFDIDVKEITSVTASTIATTSIDGDDIPEDKKEHTKEDSDSYIDSVLENRYFLESAYSKLDPYSLDDDRINNFFLQSKRKNKNSGNNHLDLKNGLLENLSRLKRISDCTIPIWRKSNVTFICYLGFDELEMKYNAKSYIENHISDFELITSITNTRLSVKITSSYKDNVPNLQDFSILNTGKITVKTAQVIADTYYSSNIYNTESIIKHFSSTLLKILNGRFKEVLSYSIYKTPLHFLKSLNLF
ncbi:uncharacterized protein NPIL_27211 [Nephila pilipes]|uniref:Uncharacterized protein n=1 Tax=Nephila pilipes TaxID=299642 RepID=A0A8X6QQP5_NEPPI|nr:uncharacterized protein NPIL_27211 [Nephila pilipes]